MTKTKTKKRPLRWFNWGGEWETFINQTIAMINTRKQEIVIQKLKDANYISKGIMKPFFVNTDSKEVVNVKYGAKLNRFYFNKLRAICYHEDLKIGDELDTAIMKTVLEYESKNGSILPIPKNDKVPQFV